MTSRTRTLLIAGALVALVLLPGSSSAASLIQKFEGLKLTPYYDVNGWAVGYGSHYNYDAGRAVRQTDKIDAQTALKWLKLRIAEDEQILDRLVKVPITRNQRDSLLSLMYNIGSGNFQRSNLLAKLNNGRPIHEVADEFDGWNTADGRVLPELTRRRAIEKKLFLS